MGFTGKKVGTIEYNSKEQELNIEFDCDTKRCITFDKEAQDNLPQHIKDRMKADRGKASKIMPHKSTICTCGHWGIERVKYCSKCGKEVILSRQTDKNKI